LLSLVVEAAIVVVETVIVVVATVADVVALTITFMPVPLLVATFVVLVVDVAI
jgi:hypothetical protein